MPKLERKCIASWQKMKNYKIMRWDESTFDINSAPKYVIDAYKQHKYSFVSDYVRLYALYKFGGVYLDTDVLLIKDFDTVLKNANLILCYESKVLMTGFIAACKGNSLIYEFMNLYDNLVFEEKNTIGYIPNTILFTRYLKEKINLNSNDTEVQFFDNGIVVYPNEFFCAFDLRRNHPRITNNTFTCHLYSVSWNKSFLTKIKRLVPKLIGYRFNDKIYEIKEKFFKSRSKWDDVEL